MLTADQPSMYLGKLKFGKPHSFKYLVTNEGDDTVTINKMVAGCTSCTVASTTNTEILPGKSGIINATYTPGKIGPSTKHINVIYNRTQILRLEFKADVE